MTNPQEEWRERLADLFDQYDGISEKQYKKLETLIAEEIEKAEQRCKVTDAEARGLEIKQAQSQARREMGSRIKESWKNCPDCMSKSVALDIGYYCDKHTEFSVLIDIVVEELNSSNPILKNEE